MSMDRYTEWLGWKVKDKVTGFTGVVTHVSLDLYGCIQAIVFPPVHTKDGQQVSEDGRWFDPTRLERQGTKRVMEPVPVKELNGNRPRLPNVSGADHYKPVR